MHDDDLPSTEQAEWIEVTDLVRSHILWLLKEPDQPRQGELKVIIEAAREAVQLELAARSLDKCAEAMRGERPWGCNH